VKVPRSKNSSRKAPKARDPHGSKAAATGLSGDEDVLWRHVATSIEPLKAKQRVRRQGVSRDEIEPVALTIPERRPALTQAAKSVGAPASTSSTSALGKTPPALADFDARKAKKIGSGRVRIEARLDLHGMRQDDALGRLRAFLVDCHARHLKTVLVITGKGRDFDDVSVPYADTLDRSPRGVLRRNLPRWLAEPDLRAIVVGYISAAQQHGGDGAFYIELRRNRSSAHLPE
jgi:DNA-nicking Smr family endonuclease